MATAEERAQMLESGWSSDEQLPPAPRARLLTPKRLIAVTAGVLGLAGCGLALNRSGNQPVNTADHVSARALLEHPDFLDAASNNIVMLGKEKLNKDMIRPAAGRAMKKLSELMEVHHPEGAKYLDSVMLSPKQRGDVVAVVKHMSNKHVQDVGHQVVAIAHAHTHEADGIKHASEELKKTFEPRLGELQDLKKSVFPASIRDADSGVQVEVKERRLTVATTTTAKPATTTANCGTDDSKNCPGGMMTSAMAKASNMKLEDAMGIIGGLLEQGRIACDAAAVIAPSFGSTNHVPWEVRSLLGGAAFASEAADCVMRADDVHQTTASGTTSTVVNTDGHMNEVKAMLCPLKYASAAMDMLSGVNNVAGIQNSNLGTDFQMMMGGGQPQTTAYNYNQVQPRTAYYPQQQVHPQTVQNNPIAQMARAHQSMTQMAQMAHSLMGGTTAQQPTVQQNHNPFTYTR